MLQQASDAIVGLMDFLMGWLLLLPKDVALVGVAILSSTVLVLVRRFATDQDLLRRCSLDMRRIKELMRETKKKPDKARLRQRLDAVQGALGGTGFDLLPEDEARLAAWLRKAEVRSDRKRFTDTMAKIRLKTLKAEGRPLLLSLVPIAFLAIWCFERLAYHPPAAGQPVQLVAYFPLSAAGKTAHVVPLAKVSADGGWLREIEAVTVETPPHAKAVWSLQASADSQPYRLQVRFDGKTYARSLLVGQTRYAPPLTEYTAVPGEEGIVCTEIAMKPVKLFGLLPGIPALGLAPWIVAYLVLVFPVVYALKALVRVY